MNKEILKYKKDLFSKEVEKSAIALGVPIPQIKFWKHYEDHFDKGERAHIHIKERLICISEPELNIMDEDEIIETATHEVAHLYDAGHGPAFQDAQIDLKIASWAQKYGRNGAFPEGYTPTREKKIIKNKCFECNSKKDLHKCKYCEFYFCEKHKKPKLAGFINFKSTNPRDLAIIEESKKEGGHPCIPYTKYLEEKKKREEKNYDYALNNLLSNKRNLVKNYTFKVGKVSNQNTVNYIKVKEDYNNTKTTTKRKLSHIKEYKEKKHIPSILKWFLIISIILILTFFLVNKFVIKNKSKIESKEMSNMVFSKINQVRAEKLINEIEYNKHSYNLAVAISQRFYESHTYSLTNSELISLSKEYNIENPQILVRKLNNLNQSSFNLIALDWTSKSIFTEKTLDEKLNKGAIGCWENVCVFILS